MYAVRLSESSAKFISEVIDYSFVYEPGDKEKFYVFGRDLTSEILKLNPGEMEARFGPPYNVREIKIWEFDFATKEDK